MLPCTEHRCTRPLQRSSRRTPGPTTAQIRQCFKGYVWEVWVPPFAYSVVDRKLIHILLVVDDMAHRLDDLESSLTTITDDATPTPAKWSVSLSSVLRCEAIYTPLSILWIVVEFALFIRRDERVAYLRPRRVAVSSIYWRYPVLYRLGYIEDKLFCDFQSIMSKVIFHIMNIHQFIILLPLPT